jgi:hypothetical protein
MADDPRCRRCGQVLHDPDSIERGYGPDCARSLGLSDLDWLPQRCRCCRHTQAALRLLYGVGMCRRFVRLDGSYGWVDVATGEVVPVPVLEIAVGHAC